MSRAAVEAKAFRTGLVLKLIDGGGELVGAIVIWFVTPATAIRIAHFFTDRELAEDPHDAVANYIVALAQRYGSSHARVFLALYLAAHGVVKVVLVVALFRGWRWAHSALIATLSLFILYQGYLMIRSPSLELALLTAFDAAIVWLTWRDHRRNKSNPPRDGRRQSETSPLLSDGGST